MIKDAGLYVKQGISNFPTAHWSCHKVQGIGELGHLLLSLVVKMNNQFGKCKQL